MAYCTQADLEAIIDPTLLVKLTDEEGVGAVNATRLERAIANADATIDAHLRTHYAVPLTTVPAFIRLLSANLTIYGLFRIKAHLFEMPKWIENEWREDMKTLTAIRRGDLDLGVEPPPAASAAAVATTDGPEREYTHDTLEDF